MKKIALFLFTTCFVISLASCGGSSLTEATTTTTIITTTTTGTRPAATTTTTEASATTTGNTTYNDDDLVPKEWLSVYTTAEALEHFDEIANADFSDDDISAEILSLVHKNVLFFTTMRGKTFEIDWDNPNEGEGAEADLYPIKSEYFSEIESIEILAYDTYTADIAEELLLGTEEDPRVLFTEKNGEMYIDPNCLSNWSSEPFYMRSYIEITDTTDESVSFIWHYPDFEGLNEPDKYNYFYYENSYTATYENGELRLAELLIND